MYNELVQQVLDCIMHTLKITIHLCTHQYVYSLPSSIQLHRTNIARENPMPTTIHIAASQFHPQNTSSSRLLDLLTQSHAYINIYKNMHRGIECIQFISIMALNTVLWCIYWPTDTLHHQSLLVSLVYRF